MKEKYYDATYTSKWTMFKIRQSILNKHGEYVVQARYRKPKPSTGIYIFKYYVIYLKENHK